MRLEIVRWLSLASLLSLALAGPARAAEPSLAWQAAQANRAIMKTAPAFVEGPKAQLPESEKALGHHGVIFVEGIVDGEGRMQEARVRETSGAPALDAIALAAAGAATFTPAKDAAGAALPVVATMAFDLVAYKSAEGMGILKYKCGQFVRDMDWWRSVHPDTPFQDHELYKLEIGYQMLSLIQQARGDRALLARGIAGFEKRWNESIEKCRKKPDMLQRDAIYR